MYLSLYLNRPQKDSIHRRHRTVSIRKQRMSLCVLWFPSCIHLTSFRRLRLLWGLDGLILLVKRHVNTRQFLCNWMLMSSTLYSLFFRPKPSDVIAKVQIIPANLGTIISAMILALGLKSFPGGSPSWVLSQIMTVLEEKPLELF